MNNYTFKLICLGILLALLPGAVCAQEFYLPENLPDQTRFRPDALGQLQKIAEDRGKVRVLVRLNVGFTPEGMLSSAGKSQQRASIKTAQTSVLNALAGEDFTVHYRYGVVPSLAVSLSPEAVGALENHPMVESIRFDRLSAPTLDQSIPHIRANRLHDAGDTGTNWMVVILDTGLDSSHDAFGGRVVEQACYASGTDATDDTTGHCPNGEVKDTADTAGEPINSSGDHGTHVGGIAAGGATATPSPSLPDGVAPGADIATIQIFSDLAVGLRTYNSDQLAALEHVHDTWLPNYDIASVNMSLGGGQHGSSCDDLNPDKTDMIQSLRSKNVATVISSGNDGFTDSIGAPACISDAVAVGSVDSGTPESISSFSNQEPNMVDIIAPGNTILSATPGNTSDEKFGTSMAAPHVSGLWAVLQEATFDTKTVDEIEQAIINNGVTVNDERSGAPANADYTSVRATEALEALSSVQVTGSPSGSEPYTDQVQFNLSISGDGAEEVGVEVTYETAGGLTGTATLVSNANPDTVTLDGNGDYSDTRSWDVDADLPEGAHTVTLKATTTLSPHPDATLTDSHNILNDEQVVNGLVIDVTSPQSQQYTNWIPLEFDVTADTSSVDSAAIDITYDTDLDGNFAIVPDTDIVNDSATSFPNHDFTALNPFQYKDYWAGYRSASLNMPPGSSQDMEIRIRADTPGISPVEEIRSVTLVRPSRQITFGSDPRDDGNPGTPRSYRGVDATAVMIAKGFSTSDTISVDLRSNREQDESGVQLDQILNKELQYDSSLAGHRYRFDFHDYTDPSPPANSIGVDPDENESYVIVEENSTGQTGVIVWRPAGVDEKARTFPNPFNPEEGNVSFEFPSNVSEGDVHIFTVDRRQIKELKNLHHLGTWDGRTDSGELVSPGIYIYVINHDKGVSSGEIVVTR